MTSTEGPTVAPLLDEEPAASTATLRAALAGPPGVLRLPAGRHELSGGLRIGAGWVLEGAAEGVGTTLVSQGHEEPLLHVVGSQVEIRRLRLEVPAAAPGEHAGDRATALTVGSYLYPGPADWIEGVRATDVDIVRHGGRGANSVAIMGAVRDVDLVDIRVRGGETGVAVHWGAVGSDVASLAGPSYHPHRLRITDLQVQGAFEGFYLSSVYDVQVRGARLADVEIGFRILAGDNGDRFLERAGQGAAPSPVSRHIEVSDCDIAWHGPLYAIRVAGWGRSEVDGVVSLLPFHDVSLVDCRLRMLATRDDGGAARAAVVLERAPGVTLRNLVLDVEGDGREGSVDLVRSDGPGRTRADLTTGP